MHGAIEPPPNCNHQSTGAGFVMRGRLLAVADAGHVFRLLIAVQAGVEVKKASRRNQARV